MLSKTCLRAAACGGPGFALGACWLGFFLFCVPSCKKSPPKLGQAAFCLPGAGPVWRAWTCAYRCPKMCFRVPPCSRLGGAFCSGPYAGTPKAPQGPWPGQGGTLRGSLPGYILPVCQICHNGTTYAWLGSLHGPGCSPKCPNVA